MMTPIFGYHTNFYGLDTIIWSVMGASTMITLLITLAFFLLKGYGLYIIACRRGLKKAWLSWIPVGQDWIRGSVSDQYRYLTAGKIQHRRVILSVVSAIYLAFQTVVFASMIRYLLLTVEGLYSYGHSNDFGYYMARLILTGGILGFLTLCAGIARVIFHHMCMYDLYRSTDPKNDTAMTVLGIVIPLLEPFFLLYVKDKDGGMPPRRDRPNGNAQRPYNPEPERPVDPVYETPTDGPEQL